MNRVLLVATCSVLAHAPLMAQVTVHANDFEAAAGPEWSLLVAAQEAPSNKERYAKFLDEHHQRLLDQAERSLADAEAAIQEIKKRRTTNKRDEQQKKEDLERAIKKRDAARKDSQVLLREKKSKKYTWDRPALVCDSGDQRFYTGMIGPIEEGTVRNVDIQYEIVQVVDDADMLVRANLSWQYGYARANQPAQMRTRVTDPVLIRGISTAGRADGQKIALKDQYFEVTGTHTYATAVGSQRTVLVFEPFDMSGITP